MTMRDGCRLSYNALPSRRNSGEKITLSMPSFSLMDWVKPTGMVDLMIITAFGLIAVTSLITASTLDVLK
ncbi:hypothetical protein D3C80_1551950 [compost metagenome]